MKPWETHPMPPPVLLTPANPAALAGGRGLTAAMDGHIVKPLKRPVLMQVIRRVLDAAQ